MASEQGYDFALRRRVTRIFVAGVPAPQGSKTRGAHGGMFESSRKVGEWRSRVALAAQEAMLGAPPSPLPVSLRASFLFTRPKSHLTTKGQLRKGAPVFPGRPDVDKLARAVLDALTGIAFADDSQVVELVATKRYCADESVRAHGDVRGAPGVEVEW